MILKLILPYLLLKITPGTVGKNNLTISWWSWDDNVESIEDSECTIDVSTCDRELFPSLKLTDIISWHERNPHEVENQYV